MCDPFTIMALGSSAMGAFGSLSAGKAKSDASKLKMQISQGNASNLALQAEIQKLDAPLADARSSFQTGKVSRASEASIGSQITSFAHGGIDFTSGSPLQQLGYSAAQGAMDEALIGAQGSADKASAYGRVGRTMSDRASQTGSALGFAQEGDNAVTSGLYGAATALLGGVKTAWPSLNGLYNSATSGFGSTSGIAVQPAPYGFGRNV